MNPLSAEGIESSTQLEGAVRKNGAGTTKRRPSSAKISIHVSSRSSGHRNRQIEVMHLLCNPNFGLIKFPKTTAANCIPGSADGSVQLTWIESTVTDKMSASTARKRSPKRKVARQSNQQLTRVFLYNADGNWYDLARSV